MPRRKASNTAVPTLTAEQFAAVISQAISQGLVAASGPKKISIGQYNRREAERDPKAKMKRHLFQNGRECQFAQLTGEQIGLANQIRISGRYINRRVEVVVTPESIELRYPNNRDQMLENARYFTSLEDMLSKIVGEQSVKLDAKKKRQAQLTALGIDMDTSIEDEDEELENASA